VDISRALDAGLSFRSPVEIARATLASARELDELPGDAGLDPAKERELLDEIG
jgi:hypothetical protein